MPICVIGVGLLSCAALSPNDSHNPPAAFDVKDR